MSRDDGFPRADMDTSYFEDAKWKRAWRALGDPARMAQAMCLHHSTVLASWRHGERVPVTDAAPVWLPLDDDILAVLVKVGLLDAEGCIPAESFDAWYGPAAARSRASSEAGKEGNRRRWGTRPKANTDPIGTRSAPDPLPATPTTPTSQPQNAGASDPADTYWTLTGRYPTSKTLGWVDDLAETYGAEAASAAIAAAHAEDATVPTLLGRAKDRLARNARRLDVAERDAEKARVAELRKPVTVRRRPPEVSPEEAEAALAAYQAQYGRPRPLREEVTA